jgi:hypothetical protein
MLSADLFSQAYTSKDNYTGSWEGNAAWQGGSSPGLYYDSDTQVLVYGEINTNDALFFNKGLLTVRDTLVVNGNLGFGNNGDLEVESTGVLIVLGSLQVGNKVDIDAGGTIVIRDNVNFDGSSKHGSFTSDQQPAQVYIGGSITGNPPTSSSNGIPVINCDASVEHDNSQCNYGFIDDMEGKPIDEYYQEIVCGNGINPGSIGDHQSICIGEDPGLISEQSASTESTYQWYSSTDSTDPDTGIWSQIPGETGQNFDPPVLSVTTAYYRQVQKGNGCTANSNVVVITVSPSPSPVGIYHE